MNRIPVLLALIALLALPAVSLAGTSARVVSDIRTGGVPAGAWQMAGAGVTIVDFAFSPWYVTVPAGSTVSWYNAGVAPHTVTSDAGIFGSGTLGSGGSYAVTFSYAGYYGYYCAIHPGMTGAVQVS
jgi:plastocyanin